MFEQDVGKYRIRDETQRHVMDRGRGGGGSYVAVSATKPSKDYRLGLGLTTGRVDVRITTISPDGLFAGTPLKAGMVLEAVNGTKCATAARAIGLLKESEGRVVIVASDPGGGKKGASATPTGASVSSMAMVITKPSKDASLGMDLDFGDGGKIRIKSIEPGGPLAGTELRAGMRIDAVNGKEYVTFNEGAALLAEAEGRVRIVASRFDPTPRKESNDEGCCCLLDGFCAAADCGACCCDCVIS